MVANIKSFGICGINAFLIDVETDISRGVPVFDIVGQGDCAVRESKERVRAAIKNQGFDFPMGRIIINLAPAGKRKQGSSLDLPVAISILSAMGIIPHDRLKNIAFSGELSLEGNLRRVNGALPMVVDARNAGFKRFILPKSNAAEASIVDGIEILGAENLRQAVSFIFDDKKESHFTHNFNELYMRKAESLSEDFSQVAAQEQVKRVLEIAASGSHNVLMMGAAGSGKTMMAKRLLGIMPQLDFEQAFEITKIYSISGLLDEKTPLIVDRPFRALHAGVTANALVGGGRPIRPGEISLAHNGVLFLDEMAEIDRRTLESLRQPLEEGKISISRLGTTEVFPANFILVGASNPCKCGKLFEGEGLCSCTPLQIAIYNSRISKPLLDRIDLHVPVRSIKYKKLIQKGGETSFQIRQRVEAARKIQKDRYFKYKVNTNSQITKDMIDKFCRLDLLSQSLLEKAVDSMKISARGYEKVIKVARTIADMDNKDDISSCHIAEAIQYRVFDKSMNGGLL